MRVSLFGRLIWEEATSLEAFNDHQTSVEPVLQLFDRAIASLQEKLK